MFTFVPAIVLVTAFTVVMFKPASRNSGGGVLSGGTKAAVLAIIDSAGQASLGNIKTVSWTSTDYGSNKVRINLLRKVSDNPGSYELVRTITEETVNSGFATWNAQASDTGDLYVEVACLTSGQACRSSMVPVR